MSWIIDHIVWVGLAVVLLVVAACTRNWIRAHCYWALWIGALFVSPFFLHEMIDDHPVWWFFGWVAALVPVLTRFGGEKPGLAYKINSILRKADFWLNRTYGGWLQTQFRLPGYSPVVFVLTFYALLILIGGPTRSFPTGPVSWLVWFALLVLSYPCARWQMLHHFTAVAVLATAATVYFEADPDAKEAGNTIYRHVFLIVLPCVVVVAYIGRCLAHYLLVGFKNQYKTNWAGPPPLLNDAELHVIPMDPPALTVWHVLRSGFATPFSNPLMFLFPIALVVLLAPSAYLGLAAWSAAWLTWALLALAGIHDRLKNVLDWVARPFLTGVVFMASAAVIVLAGCRLADFSYVAILLNSTTVWTILWMLAAIYVTIWFYDYWIGYVLCEHLLALLNPAANGHRCSQVPYQINPANIPGPEQTQIRATGRVVQIHGTRFVVVGQYLNAATQQWKDGWELYDRIDLFETLVRRARGAGPAVARQFGLADLRQRIGVFYVVLNLLLVALIGGLEWYGRRAESVPELSATADQPGTVSLRESLFGNEAIGPRRRAIVVAASGGGTRAALFSESLFQGLAELDALPDVVLYSGVSGGSAAIADTLLHYDASLPNAAAYNWPTHADHLGAPFIDDVIRGLWEIRLHHGTRSGTLLAESLQRRLSCADQDELKLQLGSVTKVGVIFNATLAGADRWDNQNNVWANADPSLAGGRLVVTNLQGADIFPTTGFADIESEFLPYVVVRDPRATLPTAAALSANFPPAFSNAAVVLETDNVPQHRYWVTDGGASDNRGAISALYAVLHALQQQLEDKKTTPPDLHLVIADASALNLDFAQDRGISSAIGAAEKYANELMTEILTKIADACTKLGGESKNLHVYYLPMPALLRAHGGVQTHWMLPTFITLVNPADPNDKMRLPGTEVRQLIMDLHHRDYVRREAPHESPQQKKRLDEAWKWIKDDLRPERIPSHQTTWERLVKDLR